MSILNELFAGALAIFYSIVPSYGFAIIALTLVVMIVLTPLTLKGTRSMMVMQQMQPEIKKLQSRYKDDRQKLNEELLKFYKENNINPLGGCLPLIVQMPVFLVLYQVLRGLTQRYPTVGSDVGWVTGQNGVPTGLTTPPNIVTPFDPAYLPHDSELYKALNSSTTMNFAGMDLAESASQALSQGVLHALPYLALIVVVGVTGYVQQKQIQGRNPNADVNPQQQMLMKVMPIFLPVISFGLPSGLVLYFAVSNLYRIGQQAFISRSIYGMKRGETVSGKAGKPAPEKAAVGGRSKAVDTTVVEEGAGSGKAAAAANGRGGGGRANAGRGGAGRSGSAKGADKGSDKAAEKGAGEQASPGKATASKGGSGRGSGSGGDAGGGSKRSSGGRTTASDRKGGSKQTSSGPSKRPSGGAGSGGSGAATGTPALQPRARKPKKR